MSDDPRWPWRTAWIESDLSSAARHVLHVLMILPSMGLDGTARPGVSWIAKAAGKEERAIRRALAAAVKSGWLSACPRIGQPTVYAIATPDETGRGDPGRNREGSSDQPPSKTAGVTPDETGRPPGQNGGGTPPQNDNQAREPDIPRSSSSSSEAWSQEDRSRAANEIFAGKQRLKPDWEPENRWGYIRQIAASLEGEEIAEALGKIEARRLAEAGEAARAEQAKRKAEAREQADGERLARYEALTHVQRNMLSAACVPATIRAQAATNPLAQEDLKKLSIEHMDPWLRKISKAPVEAVGAG